MKSIFKRAFLTGLLAGAGFAAFAQGMPGPAGGAPQGGMQQSMHRPDPAKMQARMDQRLAALKAKLKLAPDQELAWATFTASMKPPANVGQRPNREEWKNLTTPERIDKMRAMRSLRQAEMDKRADAVKAFYAALTPEQRKVFDALHMRHHRKGGMHGMYGTDGGNPPQ